MKKHIYIVGVLAATLAFSSCQKEEFVGDFNSDPNAVHINATIGEDIAITRSNPTASDDTQKNFNANDVLSLSTTTQSAIKYTFDGTKWIPETGKYLKWEANTMDFTAFYPVGVNNTSAENFTLPTDQSDLDKIATADYMTFVGSKEKGTAGALSLEMQRKTARIIVHIAGFNDQYAKDYSVSAVSVSGNTSGYTTSAATTGAVTVSAYKATDFYALLTPTTKDDNATFLTLTVTDDTKTDQLTVKGIPAHDAGKSYTYNITVGKNGITIGSVTVKDWGGETLIGEGEADLFPFEDAAFETALINNCGVPAVNGRIALSPEALEKLKTITTLNVDGKGIKSLKGIEYMTGLTILECNNNSLTTLDVSHNTELTALYCHTNSLTTIDVSNNTALKKLTVTNNSLSTLNVSKNTALIDLYCSTNSLSTLDVSNNTVLENLECSQNSLNTLNVSKNTALKYLHCGSNPLTALNVSNNTALKYLYCENNSLTALNVSNNTALVKLSCFNNSLTTLDVSDNRQLYILRCGIQKNDVTLELTMLIGQAGASWWKGEDDSAPENLRVRVTKVEMVETPFGDVAFVNILKATPHNIPLTAGKIDPTDPTTLAALKAITTLSIPGKEIFSLKGIEYLSELTELNCTYNSLSTLDVSQNTKLEILHCYGNSLTTLDVSNLPLTYLICGIQGGQLSLTLKDGMQSIWDPGSSNNVGVIPTYIP